MSWEYDIDPATLARLERYIHKEPEMVLEVYGQLQGKYRIEFLKAYEQYRLTENKDPKILARLAQNFLDEQTASRVQPKAMGGAVSQTERTFAPWVWNGLKWVANNLLGFNLKARGGAVTIGKGNHRGFNR